MQMDTIIFPHDHSLKNHQTLHFRLALALAVQVLQVLTQKKQKNLKALALEKVCFKN